MKTRNKTVQQNKKAQWTDMKNMVLMVVLIIVLVIIVRNYVYAPVAQAGQCKGIGGTCMESCTDGYYQVAGIRCDTGICCQPESPEQANQQT
jgi:hypothetical protein